MEYETRGVPKNGRGDELERVEKEGQEKKSMGCV